MFVSFRSLVAVIAALVGCTQLSAQIEVTSGGDVGIGTSSPDAKFQVNLGSGKDVRLESGGSAAIGDYSTGGPGISFDRAHDGADYISGIFTYSDGSSNNRLALATRDDLVFAAGGGSTYFYAPERVRITSAGYVGIGTSTPAAHLSLGNHHLFQLGESDGAGGAILFRRGFPGGSNPTLPVVSGAIFYQNDGGTNGNNEAMKLIGEEFRFRQSTGGSDLLTLKTNGNVGIGTASPSEKLEVNGSVLATSFKTTPGNNTYADFVFKPDYRLPTLTEVEAHIAEKGHLPDIPSEAEAKTNGIDLAAMQVKLLQKIEELTLYAIEQDKRIESQRMENEALLARVRTLELGAK